MNTFTYINGNLHCEGVDVATIGEKFGTPSYIYSKKTIEDNAKSYVDSFINSSNLACFAVKSLSNLSILKIIKDTGCGFDIVSGGELHRAISIGADPKKIIFSGVGKTTNEIELGIKSGILSFNVESESELFRIEKVANNIGYQAPISIRINPDIDSGGHDYITTGRKGDKFGISDSNKIIDLCKYAHQSNGLTMVGLACHIGSQILDLDGYIESADKIFELADNLRSSYIKLDFLDLGGGLGISYDNEEPPSPNELISCLEEKFKNREERLILEPGRSISANSGILLTKVEYIKDNFLIVDAAMNDFLRPSLYKAHHNICNIKEKKDDNRKWNIVGPVCESSDFLAKNALVAAQEGDLLAVKDAGAYGFVMASNYNTRPKACEILVDGDQSKVIRIRETLDDLLEKERI
ncbi:diaminopimelate decarboxylase [Gammaproteobacteria bacterium]|nr:diaminopimelate decarboxylase [Gammaproteobacteria bacterium]